MMELSKVYRKALRVRRALNHPYCTAVIVAAGNASRMGGTDKIMAELDGMPVICRTLEAFEQAVQVDEIIVVTRKELLERMSELAAAYSKVRMVVPGGEDRMQSVMNGLREASDKTQLVAVHDGARPLVTDEIIARTIAKAAKFGAAAPAVPVKDTIKVSTRGAVEATPDRKTLFAVQTPQVFDFELLCGALENAQQKKLAITDDCSAVEAMGMPVQLTDGSEENLKITTPIDLAFAEAVLKGRQRL